MTPGWQTGEQTQTVDIGPDGRGTDVMRVDYQNDAGTIHGHVTVPLADGWADAAQKLLAARYAEHDQVAGT